MLLIYFFKVTMREVFFGEEGDEFEGDVASYLAAFLQTYAHEIIYAYRLSFPRLKFRTRMFDGIAVHECTEPKIWEYVEKTRKTLARWIRRRQLSAFVVVISDRPNHPSMSEEPLTPTVLFHHQARISQLLEAAPSSSKEESEVIEETTQQMDDLKTEIRNVLFELQSWSVRYEFVHQKPLYVELVCSLKPGVRVNPHFGEEHSWKRIKRPPTADTSGDDAVTSRLTSTSHNVDCEIAKIQFIQIDLCRR